MAVVCRTPDLTRVAIHAKQAYRTYALAAFRRDPSSCALWDTGIHATMSTPPGSRRTRRDLIAGREDKTTDADPGAFDRLGVDPGLVPAGGGCVPLVGQVSNLWTVSRSERSPGRQRHIVTGDSGQE
jgi:hypothetical protein